MSSSSNIELGSYRIVQKSHHDEQLRDVANRSLFPRRSWTVLDLQLVIEPQQWEAKGGYERDNSPVAVTPTHIRIPLEGSASEYEVGHVYRLTLHRDPDDVKK